MRNFSKNPNVFDVSDEDSDLEDDNIGPFPNGILQEIDDVFLDVVRTRIAEAEAAVMPELEAHAHALAAHEHITIDDSSDEDYVEESDSDESFDSKKEVVPVPADQNQPSTSAGVAGASTSATKKNRYINDFDNECGDENYDEDDDEDDDDDEEDETIIAIRNAIKKPRSTPPEIKTEDFITDLSFHPDKDIIALAAITGDVLIYKYSNDENTLLKKLEVHTKACRSIEFNHDGSCIYTGSKDKSIMITDVETEKLKKFYDNAHESAIYKLYAIDENMFATGDESGTVKLWDNRSDTFIFSLKEVEDYISAMLTNEAKKLLLVASGDGLLTTLNMTARKLFVQSEPYEEELTCMGLYRGDSKVIVGTSKGRLYTYKWGEFGYHSDMYPGVKSPIDCMLPITDRITCLGGEEGVLRATHIAPFKNLGIVGQHRLPVETMDINHSGEFIASSSHNNDVLFWNIKYFEDLTDIKYNVKNNDYQERRHNLPSSKFSNNSDFFADLAN